MYLQEISSSPSLSDNFWDEYRSIKEEKCFNIIRQIDSINIDSTAVATDRLSLRHLAIDSNRKLYLNLASKSIRDIDLSDNKFLAHAVYLNFAGNKLSRLPDQFCQHTPMLRSLNLNHNAVQAWPSALDRSCKHLNYLNLSSNHIVVLPDIAFLIRSLVVLDLSKNAISSLELSENFLSAPLSLKYLDLRYNKLKTDQPIMQLVGRSPLTVIHFDHQEPFAAWIDRMHRVSRSERPRVRLDNSSLQLIWPTTRKINYTLSLPSLSGANDPRLTEQGSRDG